MLSAHQVNDCGISTYILGPQMIISFYLLNIYQTSVFFFFKQLFFFFFFFRDWSLFIYLFLAVLGPRLCARAFSSCGQWGPLLTAMRGPLIIAGSLVAEHRLRTRRLSNCGSRALLPRGTRDLPRPGLEPVSPALAVRF